MEPSKEERINKAHKECWIRYEAADNIINRVKKLMNLPQKSRMPNLLIVGDTNNGKTSILNRLLKEHPINENTEGETKIIPLIRIQAPVDADEGRFYDLVLKEFNAPSSPSYRPVVKYNQITTIAPLVKLKTLLIDEIHDILAGSKTKQKVFRCAIKQLGNDLRIPIIGAGTIEALNAIKSDPQLSNRFTPIFIPKWKIFHEKDRRKEPFLILLSSLNKTLPLKKESKLTSKDISEKLMSMCEGLIGELVSILAMATEEAIITEKEEITLEILSKLDWVPPSARI
jgi:DNA polymerase III delta prime subunit